MALIEVKNLSKTFRYPINQGFNIFKPKVMEEKKSG